MVFYCVNLLLIKIVFRIDTVVAGLQQILPDLILIILSLYLAIKMKRDGVFTKGIIRILLHKLREFLIIILFY